MALDLHHLGGRPALDARHHTLRAHQEGRGKPWPLRASRAEIQGC